MKNTIYIVGAMIIGVVIIIFAIRPTVKSESGVSSSNTTNTTAEGSIQKSPNTQTAPDFSLERLGGGTITLAEYKGRKPVVLDFWATWCPNCKRDMPKLSALYEKYKDKVEVIGINLHENPSLVQKTISNWGVTFPIALDPNDQASRAYGVRYTNFHILIDIDGNVVKAVPGDISESDITSLFN